MFQKNCCPLCIVGEFDDRRPDRANEIGMADEGGCIFLTKKNSVERDSSKKHTDLVFNLPATFTLQTFLSPQAPLDSSPTPVFKIISKKKIKNQSIYDSILSYYY